MRSLRWLLPLVAFGGVVLGVSLGVQGAGSRPAAASGLAVAVSAGSGHTCALTTGGGVLCWGSNHDGQIGDSGVCDNACTTPANVSGLGGGVASISAGDLHTCAVNTKGGLVCWGANGDGQIGDGTTSPTRDVPTGVTGLGGEVASVSAGDLHSCAVSTAGGVKCWGLNEDGQLGDGRACGDVCTTPVDVSGLTSGIATVSAGGGHTCAVTTTGGAKCWGYGVTGALGDGSATTQAAPVDVVGLNSGVASISAGLAHTCALTIEGGVLCWGENDDGQLGDGTITRRAAPVAVSGLSSGVIAISAGDYHTCALTAEGAVRCWGLQVWGPTSEGAFTIWTTPGPILDGGVGNTSISAGDHHSCIVTAPGGVKCWGHNSYGQLGIGNIETRGSAQGVMDIGPGEVKPTLPATNTPTLPASVQPTDTTEPTATDTPSPTETPTSTLVASETPTATPTATQSDTPTASQTPTNTPTATPRLRNGDADGNGEIDAIDAALVVQYVAGLLPSINPAADADANGEIDAVDAALILQYDAGLLSAPS